MSWNALNYDYCIITLGHELHLQSGCFLLCDACIQLACSCLFLFCPYTQPPTDILVRSLTHLTHSLTHSLTRSSTLWSRVNLSYSFSSILFPGLDAYKQRKHGTSDAAQAEQTIPNTAASLALLVHSGHNLLAESPCSVQSRLKGTNPNHANCV